MLATRVRPISPSTAAQHALASDEELVGSIRRKDAAAFEALYERHRRELLSFCLYMLGSRADAEEALQVTFASAYRALLTDERPVALRPWLFTIARNQCLSILRRRRPTVELGGEAPLAADPGTGDPFHELEVREEIRQTLAGVRELPERQRAAMVLAELHGLSQAEVAEVLGVRPEQVKALVYQARSSLISERTARDADCSEIREELASARGAALLKGKLRRHVRACPDCRTYADGVRRRRGAGAFLPLLPWFTLKLRALQDALSGAGTEQLTYAGGTTLGGTVAGAAIVAGGPIKAIAVKVAAGAALLGLSTGLGAPVLSTPSVHHSGAGVMLVAKPAWLPLLGEEESATGATARGGGGSIGGGSGNLSGGQPPGGAGVPPLGGIEGGAGGAGGNGGYGAGGGPGASGSDDGSGGHGPGQAAHHVAGTSVAVAGAGAGAGGAAAQRGQHGAAQRGQHQPGGATGAAASTQSEGVEGETSGTGKRGHPQGEGGPSHKEGHPQGNPEGTSGGIPEESPEVHTKEKLTQHEREQIHEEQARTRLQERKEREKGRKHAEREHKASEHERMRERKKRELERSRTAAQHQREREQTKKQAESRRQRELKKREREKLKRSKSHTKRNSAQEPEPAEPAT